MTGSLRQLKQHSIAQFKIFNGRFFYVNNSPSIVLMKCRRPLKVNLYVYYMVYHALTGGKSGTKAVKVG